MRLAEQGEFNTIVLIRQFISPSPGSLAKRSVNNEHFYQLAAYQIKPVFIIFQTVHNIIKNLPARLNGILAIQHRPLKNGDVPDEVLLLLPVLYRPSPKDPGITGDRLQHRHF